MPGTEQGFTEGLCGILADEMEVTVDLQEILLHHALTGKMVILRKELPEITPAQDFTQEQLPPLPFHRYQHPVIPQAEYYGQDVHDGPGKMIQPQILELTGIFLPIPFQLPPGQHIIIIHELPEPHTLIEEMMIDMG
jgi:hypothetical protein